ncbi:MAG: protein kinase domain-containing protein [Bryobacteraceae bacterium]
MSPEQSIAHYRIVCKLGEGGMGAVYRATDTRLNRDVAIKVLPPAFAEDTARMQRFEREAQLLASLNHPNIAAIYGIEQGAIVMELVEGEDLKGPVPVETASHYARQIANALEAAHEKGIIHRDLKPANIKVTPDGTVKLLDFGLAKATESSQAEGPGGRPATDSPTLSLAMTQTGTILGTAAYMSPEQARGKPVDKRADIWAVGVVLYEMLTGKMLFGGGETVSDSLAAVLTREPDFNALPKDTPPRVRLLLERCLRKDPKQRLRDIGDARLTLDEAEPGVPAPAPVVPATRPRLPWILAAVFALSTLALAALWLRRPVEEARTIKFSVLPPEKAGFVADSLPAVSPDGRHLAFAAGSEGKTQIWIRDLNALAARPLPGTDGGFDPFWSPDSRFVAFFTPGKLKKVDIVGGPALTVCGASNGRGGSWNQNGVIVFTPSFGNSLSSVPATGGTATPLTTLEESLSETSHRFPWFLPDGRHFLFTARSGDEKKTAIYVGDLESKERRRLFAAASNAVYTPPGFLLFMRERTVMAQAFDATALRTTGDPFPVAEQVDYAQASIQGQFAVSQTGVLAYYSGGAALDSQLTWFDRDGKPLGTVGPPGTMQAPAISPDGGTVAVDRLDAQAGTYDLWLHDLAHSTDSRFTFDPSHDWCPVWSPDGSRILFASNRTGRWGLYQKPATGAGKEELLYETAGLTFTTDWSRDGRFAIFHSLAAKTGDDLWVLPLLGDRKAFPFLQTEFAEMYGKLSPDGRWLAYASDETGVYEVYVQTFPGKEGKWQVSAKGGTRPVWSRDGKELFYIAEGHKLMAVEVRSGVQFEHGVPKALFEARTPTGASFDVTRDGKRFLLINSLAQEANAPMTVVINWHAGVKK